MAPAAGSLDEVDGERRPDVARDQRLLDLVPGWTIGAAQVAAELRHERAAGPLESLVEGVGGGDREERGRVEGRVRAGSGWAERTSPGGRSPSTFDFEGSISGGRLTWSDPTFDLEGSREWRRAPLPFAPP